MTSAYCFSSDFCLEVPAAAADERNAEAGETSCPRPASGASVHAGLFAWGFWLPVSEGDYDNSFDAFGKGHSFWPRRF